MAVVSSTEVNEADLASTVKAMLAEAHSVKYRAPASQLEYADEQFELAEISVEAGNWSIAGFALLRAKGSIDDPQQTSRLDDIYTNLVQLANRQASRVHGISPLTLA